MKKPSLICALLLLAACGSDTHPPAPPAVPTPAPPPGPVADAFYGTLKTTVAAMPDDSEAASIDAIAVTAPDDAEPAAL